ncbi:hypothetical protein AXX12_13900 [Anaerosporomusa subterranea]|uniref:YknX-like C-terminal permuted SH3-like domain-containing protein n=1 Tax=Anaerosporomusa subterranea TaxID=1794912 RepID=A0A154BMP8_ANASB|nr:efflux RND transporter periplasmic adaptor subunit [Anaerosporomusa subterranea]KYZ75249.1 hypothetical protein AXX12_13900 [Anaerosporomusa subterranea]
MAKDTLKKYAPIVMAALLCACAIFIAVRSELLPITTGSRTPIHVTTAAVSTIHKPVTIIRAGSVKNAVTIPVNAEFAGSISDVFVTEKQSVKAGQPLFKLQAIPGAAGDTAANPSQAAQSNYVKALEEYNRYQALYELGGISRVQLENAKSRLQAVQGGSVGSKNSASATTTAENRTVTIESPIDGTVIGLTRAPGKMIQAGEQVMALGNGQAIEAVVRLEQSDLYGIQLSAPAAIEVASQTITGQVAAIYPAVEANQVSAFWVHIKFTSKAADTLKPGMSANIRISTGDSVTVPVIPTAAILQDNQGQTFIYIADNGKAVRQQVDIGETKGEFTEITSNVPAEVRVIKSNLDKIKQSYAIIDAS